MVELSSVIAEDTCRYQDTCRKVGTEVCNSLCLLYYPEEDILIV